MVARTKTEELSSGDEATLFESRAWLQAYGIADLLRVSGAQEDGTTTRLLFARRDRHLVHLGRLLWFDAACIDYLADLLLGEDGIEFVVFEDVQIVGAPNARSGTSVFHYQRNWQIVLSGPEADNYRMSTKAEAENRRKLRALERDLGNVRIVAGEKPSRDILAAIVALHREKIESLGKKHGIDAEELERLSGIAAQIGYGVTIFEGDRVIAGDIICIVGGRAFGLVGGYSMNTSRYSPGIITHRRAIEACRERGVLDFNMLWGDGGYKQQLGGQARPLATIVRRRSPGARFTTAYLRTVGGYHWRDLKARVKPLVERHMAH